MTKFYYPIPERGYKAETYNCEKCGIRAKRELNTPNMQPAIGPQYDGLVIVSENVTREDDKRGIPLMNKLAVEHIRTTFMRKGINLLQHAAIVPLVGCQIGKITDTYARCCFENHVDKWLTDLKPKAIVTLGQFPFKYVMHNSEIIGQRKIRGRIIPNYYYNCVVFPLFNPNDIDSYHYRDAMKWDIKRIINKFKDKYHKRTEVNAFLDRRKILKDISIIEIDSVAKMRDLFDQFLKRLRPAELSLDYETTNTKPYDDDFEIILVQFGMKSTAWCIHEDVFKKDWVFFKEAMRQLLLDDQIKKIIQNSKFEDLASRHIFGIDYIHNVECTMIATHVIDERRGCTSLDFQNLTRFGIPPYNSKTKQFLKIKPKAGEIIKVNRIRECDKKDLINYGALDVITTYNNWQLLKKLMVQSYERANDNYQFLKDGVWSFANMSQRGVTIDTVEQNRLINYFQIEMDKIMERIMAIPEFQEYNEFVKKTKFKEKKPIESIREKLNANKSTTGSGRTGNPTPNVRLKLQIASH